MIVYHGSYKKIEKIDLSKTKPERYFGKGFYATNIFEQAEIWAKKQGEYNNCSGVVSNFEFHENAFSDEYYKTLRFLGYTNEWLEFVIDNRKNKSDPNMHEYDIVEGPVADDKIYTRIENYIRGEISKEQFLQVLIFEKPSHQICFCTEKSLISIERIKSPANKIESIGMSVVKYLVNNDGLSETVSEELFFNSDTYEKLQNEHSMLYLKPWQETYGMIKKEIEKTQAKQKDDDDGLYL